MADKKPGSKPDGWFSRRHQTSDAHQISSAAHANKADRRSQAENRAKNHGTLTITDRIQVLDARLGTGVGAKRERARIARQMNGA